MVQAQGLCSPASVSQGVHKILTSHGHSPQLALSVIQVQDERHGKYCSCRNMLYKRSLPFAIGAILRTDCNITLAHCHHYPKQLQQQAGGAALKVHFSNCSTYHWIFFTQNWPLNQLFWEPINYCIILLFWYSKESICVNIGRLGGDSRTSGCWTAGGVWLWRHLLGHQSEFSTRPHIIRYATGLPHLFTEQPNSQPFVTQEFTWLQIAFQAGLIEMLLLVSSQ